MGLLGVILLMVIECVFVPLPSEVIMPLGGWMLVEAQGGNIWGVLALALFGALGSLIGSLFIYLLGLKGGRPLLERYGHYLFISAKDLESTDRWFAKHGELAICAGRMLPVFRSLISFPAGVARMNLVKFTLYSYLGAFIYCFALAYCGYLLGENWETLRNGMRPFDIPIAVGIIALLSWYVWRRVRAYRRATRSTQ
ncbi:MAG: DedA family protein [Dehalococcoidia bacterium]|nr:DedA family protein [Dehalococcoidia bacterium]